MGPGDAARSKAGLATLAAMALGCAGPQVSKGLMDGNWAVELTMAAQGDIGIEAPTADLRQLDLPSGLRVGFERAPTRGMVGVVLIVGGGATRDPIGKEGLAHLVEHLTFHSKLEQRTVSEALARLAATYNADTSLDRTRFYEFAPRAALPALLRLAAQRLTRPLAGVEADDFAVEREIVRNELRQRNETMVLGQVGEWTQRALFPGDHPYARPIGGSLASVAALTLEDARAQVKATYAPQNATLLIVGDFDLQAAVGSIMRDFPAALVGSAAAPHTHEPPTRLAAPAYLPAAPPRPEVLKAGVAWPEIWLTYYLADMYGPYAPTMKALAAPGVVKTLRDILEKDDDVSDVEITTTELRYATVFSCRVTLIKGGRRAEIAENARQLISSLWSDPQGAWLGGAMPGMPRTLSLLSRTQKLAVADAIFESEPFTGRAITRAEYFHMTGAVNAYDGLIASVAALPFQSIAQHGAYLLTADRARVLFVEPLPEDQRPPPGPVGVPTISNRKMSDVPVEGDDYGEPPPSPPVLELEHIRRFELKNGMRVALVRRPQFPGITAALGFGGGAAASPRGVVELLRLLEHEDTFAMDQNALKITKADSEGYSADVVVAGRRNLSNALYLLAARLKVLDKLKWPKVIANVRSSVDRVPAAESPEKRSTRALWHAIYGDHPYSRVLGLQDLRAVEADTLKEWLPHIYNPRNATLVIAGDFAIPTAENLAKAWFENWIGADGMGDLEVPPVPPPARGPKKSRETVVVTHRPGATQVELVLGCRLPGDGGPQGLATARMLAGVVAGQLGTQLREEAGAAYTVSGSATVLRGGGAHMFVRAAIDNLRFADSLHVIRGHWASFARDGFDQGTLSQVRWELTRQVNLSFQTSTEAVLQVLEGANQGWTSEELVALSRAHLTVGVPELRRAFAMCRSTTVLSLLGDRPSIEAALATPR